MLRRFSLTGFGLLAVLLVSGASARAGSGPDSLWHRSYDSTESRCAAVRASDGGYVISGSTASGASEYDLYLLKTDQNGNLGWSKTYGGPGYDSGFFLIPTADGGYLTGGQSNSYSGDGTYELLMIKTDAYGDSLWLRTFDGPGVSPRGRAAFQTADEGYFVAGRAHGGEDGDDCIVVRTEANGHLTWSKMFRWPQRQSVHGMVEAPDGGLVLVGENSDGYGHIDVFAAKISAAGDSLWMQTYGETDRDIGYAVDRAEDGGYIVAGSSQAGPDGNDDFYLVRIDEGGDTLWTRSYWAGGGFREVAYSVKRCSDGGFMVAGEVWRGVAGTYKDVFLVRTDSGGDTLWTRKYGTHNHDWGYSVLEDADHQYIVAGRTGAKVYLLKTTSDPISGVIEPSWLPEHGLTLTSSPNPTHASTTIDFMLPSAAHVDIVVHNALGQEIRRLMSDGKDSGRHSVAWDHRDWRGHPVSPGIYFIRLEAGDQVATRKAVLLR